jgi:drug/metabolite transporter (DMT)-like permease
MLLFAAFVSSSYSLGAMVAHDIGPAAINAARFAMGIAIMAATATLALRSPPALPRAVWRYGVLGVLMTVFFITMFLSLRLTDPVSSGAVFTLMPLFSALFGRIFLGEAPRPVVIVSLLIAGAGAVWVIFRGDVDAMLGFRLGPGETVFVAGVICHAAYAPLVRRFNRGEPTVAFTLWTLVATGLCLALYGAREIVTTDWAALPPLVWAVICYLAVFTTAGTFFLLQFGAMRLPAAKVLAYTYLTPSIIILYEGLLGHGWASPAVLAGAAVTIVALAVLALAPDAQ